MTDGVGAATEGTAVVGRRPAFDGLRGVACLMVVCGHLWTIVPDDWLADRTGPLYGLFQSGSLGVTLFLVLGGFLVTRSLLEHQARTGSFDVARFWGRRLLRIGPQLYLLLATLFVVSRFDRWDEWPLAMTDRTLSSIATFRFNLQLANGDPAAFRPDVGHMWYLGMEQQVYVVWVLVLAWLGRFRLTVLTLLVGGIAATYWWRNEVWSELGEAGWWKASLHTLSRADGLLLGCVAAVVFPYVRRFSRAARNLAGPALVALVVLMLFSPQLEDVAYLKGQGIAFVFVAAVLVLAIAVADADDGVTERVLSISPLRIVGAVSFPIYLWHLPMFWAASRWAPRLDWAPRAVLTVLAVAAVVFVTDRFVERPIAGWLHRQHAPAAPPTGRPAPATITATRPTMTTPMVVRPGPTG